jgi:prepilin-type N-terminal cleavage/methylation domain-containing protein
MAADSGEAGDSGFTLLETIVVVLLVAVLASVMVAVVAVILRNAPATETRVDNSNSYRGLIIWLPKDVASTPPTGFAFGSPSTLCSGATAGASLVQLTWTAESGTKFAIDYRLVSSAGAQQIDRHACWGTGSAPYPNATVINATENLFGASAALRAGGRGVTMTLTTCGPDDCASPGPIITFDAGSRNPANTLPP